MLTSLICALSMSAPAHNFAGPAAFNYVGTSNANYPSIDKSGQHIAYQVTDPSTGYTSVHVYDTVNLTDTTVSGSMIHCGVPRISRSGSAVVFFGGFYQGPGYVVYPYMVSSSGTSPVRVFTSSSYTNCVWSSVFETAPCPGVSDSISGNYTVVWADLLSTPSSLWTASVAIGSSVATPSSSYSSSVGAGSNTVDISSGAGHICYADAVSGVNHMFRDGSDQTVPATQDCSHARMDGAGDKITFDSADTNLVAGTPPLSTNVFVWQSGSILIPYSYTGNSPIGFADWPQISEDGGLVAFDCVSLAIGFQLSYAYGTGITSPAYASAVVPWDGSAAAWLYSVEDANTAKIVPGYYPSLSNDNGSGPIVAFWGTPGIHAKIIAGVTLQSVYYVQ